LGIGGGVAPGGRGGGGGGAGGGGHREEEHLVPGVGRALRQGAIGRRVCAMRIAFFLDALSPAQSSRWKGNLGKYIPIYRVLLHGRFLDEIRYIKGTSPFTKCHFG
jgi:hypothetical protein